ncbi:hypothetical protein [Phaeobacter sp.]|uniref:hypothetical protein n=1 Tax=Phaeobacter sp. TaxID=1902409 RepID=UPI0025F4A917|nr:hypothetical protein [Phaeobacter sp.]
MNWTDTTHSYSLSTCMHLGRPCPAAERMIARLSSAMMQARSSTQDDFEITGTCQLDTRDAKCPASCPAIFVASHDRIRVFGGVAQTDDQTELNRFADALFDPEAAPMVSTDTMSLPCSLAQAVPLPPKPSARQTERALQLA